MSASTSPWPRPGPCAAPRRTRPVPRRSTCRGRSGSVRWSGVRATLHRIS